MKRTGPQTQHVVSTRRSSRSSGARNAAQSMLEVGVGVCVCVRVCEPPWHMGAEGQSFCFHTTSLQGDRGVAGELRLPKLSPCNPGKRTCVACAWAPLWAAGGALTFVHFSFHFVLRHTLVSDVARGRNLTPDGSSHLVLHAVLDVWHVWHKTFHPIFVHHHHPPHSPLSRLALALCRIYQCASA